MPGNLVGEYLHDNEFTKRINPNQPRLHHSTLGVESELRRHAMNEYLQRNENKAVIGADDPDRDDPDLGLDDLLLTNAITEDEVQDKIDKTRYLKETKSWVSIHSGGRQVTEREILLDKNCSLGLNGAMQPVVKTMGKTSCYATPNSYLIDCGKCYNNVKSVRLISSEIPNTATVIDTRNNQLSFQIRSGSLQVLTSGMSQIWDYTIPVGNYTVKELSKEMETGINQFIDMETNGVHKDVFKIEVDINKNIFEIMTNGGYTFIWEFITSDLISGRNLHEMLGFPTNSKEKYSTGFNNLIRLPGDQLGQLVPFKPINLNSCRYIWMKLKGLDHIFDGLTCDTYFAKFNFKEVLPNQYAYDTFTPSAKIFEDQVLTRLNEFEISFFDDLGNPHNFNGVDHSFTLEIVHHRDRFMGSNYDSRRGINDKTSYL